MKNNLDVISWAMDPDRSPCQLEAGMRGYGLIPSPDDKEEDLRDHLLTHLRSLDPMDVAMWQPPDEIEEEPPQTFWFVREPEDIIKDVVDGSITHDEGARQLTNFARDAGMLEEKAEMLAVAVFSALQLGHLTRPQPAIVIPRSGSARDPFKRTTRRPNRLTNNPTPLSRGTGTNASVKKAWHWLKTH